jgi:ABC-type nickel/cobalt efflux system permease component RcnA
VIGLFWGLGHTLTLLAAGLAILSFRRVLSESLTLSFELAVGVLMVGLGLETVWSYRRKQVHVHRHEHGSGPHLHFHSHRSGPAHTHDHARPSPARPLLIGLVHGLAGSGALALLALSSAPSLWQGLLFICLFGVGSILGMMAVTAAIGLPVVFAARRLGPTQQPAIRLTAGLASLAFGLWIVATVGPGLLGGQAGTSP